METNNWNQTENKPWGAMNVFSSFEDFYQHKYFPLQLLFCQECSANCGHRKTPHGSLRVPANQSPDDGARIVNPNGNQYDHILKWCSKPVWTSKNNLENRCLNLLVHWIHSTSKWKTNRKSGSFDTLQVPKSKQVRIWKSSSGRDLSETWFIFRVQPL